MARIDPLDCSCVRALSRRAYPTMRHPGLSSESYECRPNVACRLDSALNERTRAAERYSSAAHSKVLVDP
jgi:hypothetical protein